MHDVRAEPVPLSYGQQRLWFLDQLAGGSPHYNILEAQRWRGPIDVRALARTLQAIVARHESLRTCFAERDGELLQVIEPARPVPLPVIDLCGIGADRQTSRVRTLLRGERARPFDLARGPLIRVMLLRIAEEEHIFLRSIHHIAYDGWSRGIMNREVALLYDAFCSGQPDPLAPLPFQYADFAIWQRQWFDDDSRLQDGLAYWKAQLDGLPERLDLPADRPRPAVATFGAGVCRSLVSVPCLAALKRLSREHRATLYMTLLAAFGVLVARYSGQGDVAVGSPISDRRDQRLEGLIGLFVNLIVLRVRVQPSMRMRELLTDVRRTALDAFTHQHVPFERVVEVVAPHRSPDRLPLFQILFAVQNVPLVAAQLTGVNVEPVHLFEAGAGVDLEVYVGERRGELEIAWDYNRDLFDAWRVEQMARHYERILEAMAADPDAPIERLVMLDPVERHQILEEWNATAHPSPDTALATQFMATVEAVPDAVAVTSAGRSLSYRALNEQANRLAHLLIARGTGLEDVVAIAVPRSIDMVIALMAAIKTGAAYLPLDTESPAPRLAYMLADAGPRWLLTTSAMADRLPGGGRLVLDDPATRRALAASATGDPEIASGALTPQHAAYIIYTSGSTGNPKAAVGTQGGFVNRHAWFADCYDFRRAGPVLGKSPFSFIDGSSELLGPLLHGGRVVLADDDAARSTAGLASLIAREGVGLVTVVPSLLRALVEDGPRTELGVCRVWASSGEALPAQTAAAFADAFPDAQLLNMYGASEAASDSLYGICRAGDAAIGVPVWNTRVYVLDRRLALVPIGVPGELYVAGDGVGRGYLGRPALTADRFLPDPYGAPGTRMYRMGDLARWRADGRVEYLGRIDDQVKIRGCRVEPGELQAALVRAHGIADAAVVALPDPRGETCLVGYVVPEAGHHVDSRIIREALRQMVPDYLVPSAIVALERLPRTPHGKLDRRALPTPDLTPAARSEPPKTREEDQLCAMFAEVLGVDRVGTGDDFFDLGGHSILAMRLLNRLRSRFGIELSLRVLFDAPTVGELAQRLVKA